MSLPSGASRISDSRRDAEKYHNLLFAIENATGTINILEREDRASIDQVLESLLPNLTEALDAARAFVAVHHSGKSNRSQAFKLISVYPKLNSPMDFLPWSDPLAKVLSSPRARVIEPLDDDRKKLIRGLEMFNATTAILMRMQIGPESRIIGVCNRIKSEMGPFLATDRRALESIIELIAIGMRVGERRRQELENIQSISAAISAQLNPVELLPLIARKAAEVFSAPAASLMLWDKKQENLVIEASHGLSPEYVRQQRIPRKKVKAEIIKSKNARAIFIPDLHQSPFGKPDLIQSERLRSALTAQLQVSDELIGILNIYSQDTVRKFTTGELELAQIFANHAAIAIHNARLRQRDLENLLATSDALKATLDEGKLLQLIVEKVSGLFAAPASLIFWDKNDQRLIIKAAHGLSKDYVGYHFAVNDRVFALNRQKKDLKPAIITHLSRPAYGLQNVCEQEQLANAIIAPLALPRDPEAMGFLVIFGKDTSRTFTVKDIKTASIVANQAVIAIRTSQLYGENKQRKDHLDRLINSSPDGIITVDKDGWVIDYNEGAERICGYSRTEILGQKTHVEKLHGDVLRARTIQHHLLNQERLDNYETVLLAKDGQQIPIMLSATLLQDKDNNDQGSFRFLRDLRPIQAILTTYHEVARARNLDEGLCVLAEGMVKGMGITFCQILFLEPNNRSLKVRAAHAVHRLQAKPVEWQPRVGELLDLEMAAPVIHMLRTYQPEMYRRGAVKDGIVMTEYVQNMVGLQADLQSVLLVPLKSDQRVTGICILGEVRNWKRNPFNVEKIGLVRSMADQAAELIHRLQTHEALRLREGLLKAGKEITSLQNLPQILQAIADGVRNALNCDLVTLYTYNEAKGKVDLPTVSGTLRDQDALFALGYVSKQSIVWRLLQNGEPHFADDAPHDPWMMLAETERHPGAQPFVLREGISSSAGIPLVMGNEKVGILFASFRTQHPFIEQERNDIKIFATQAAMAIYNARLYDEVKKTKDYLMTSQTVAWLGLFGADLQHTIHQKAFSLDNIATGLRIWLKKMDPPPEDIQEVLSIVDKLDDLSNNIRDLQSTSQSHLNLPEATGAYILIDEELSAICEKLTQDHPEIEKRMELNCPDAKVIIAPEGLMIAMEKLANNAIKAMPNGGQLSVCTNRVGKMIHIQIKDNGHGIPEESRLYFLKGPLPRKRRSEGSGKGVLIARFVAISHGGDLELISTSLTGTELRMTLPVVTE